MSYTFYKVLHVFGALLLFMSLGGGVIRALQAGSPGAEKGRALIGASHGIALLILLVAGFGAAGKGGMMSAGFPAWIIVKLVIWLALGGLLGAINRKPQMAKPLWAVFALLGGLAAYTAILKPF